jgi:S1-C subfamily serine protease
MKRMLYRMTRVGFLLSCLSLQTSASDAPDAREAQWRTFAVSSSAEIFLDPGSVRVDSGHIRYRVRVEYTQPKQTADGKYRFRSSEQEVAARCSVGKVAVVAFSLFDDAGRKLLTATRPRDSWVFKPVKAGSPEEKLLEQLCSREARRATAAGEGRQRTSSIGAGIVVSSEGQVLTNNHVVRDCASVFVEDSKRSRVPARVLGVDAKNDLGLIRAETHFSNVARFRANAPILAGEAVTVIGYPLAGILGTEPNVTFGYVGAVTGIGGDTATFLISAPVHKGNSGGPILDQNGDVIGVVSSKLNAIAVEKKTGDLPQNISFGIKGEVARLFLQAQGSAYQAGTGGARLENPELAAKGKSVTVLVRCERN